MVTLMTAERVAADPLAFSVEIAIEAIDELRAAAGLAAIDNNMPAFDLRRDQITRIKSAHGIS
jgi:hypothetical protein